MKFETQNLRINDLIVLPCVERPASKVPDDRDARSIQQGGIQQPLIAIECEDRVHLAKGLRRLRIARHLGIQRVPVIVYPLPDGREIEEYVREVRLILQMHRQDLSPSQKAGLVETLKSQFDMTHREVSAYLGISPDSVTNWLAARNYIKPVQEALDAGLLTMQTARVFDGLTDQGQRAIWKGHQKELVTEGGGEIHKELRRQYSPEAFPAFYRNPELIAQRLARKGGPRKAKGRTSITADEKRRLLTSFELKETELETGKRELARLKKEINAAITPIAAILRNEKLWSQIPDEMKPELEAFASIYV